MSNINANIELNYQPQRRNPRSPNRPFGYHPQEDEDHHHQGPQIPPSIDPHNTSKLKACIKEMFTMNIIKAAKIAFYLMVFFYLIDLVPLYHFEVELNSNITPTSHIWGALEFVSANLKADPIMDIRIIDKASACPSGFEPLHLGTWPGTVAGCLCDNGDLFSSPCDKAQSEKCQMIPETYPVDMYEMDGSIWCGKRSVLEIDYLKKAECPTGYKECYIGGCFLKECPVTKVEMTSQTDLLLTRTQGELPLIDIRTTPNDLPCFNQDFYPNSPGNNSSYPLLNISECGKYGLDTQFSKRLDSEPISDAYTQDSYRYSVMNLPDYERSAKRTMSVTSWRTRIMTARNDYCLTLDEKLLRDSLMFTHEFPFDGIIIQAVSAHFVLFITLGLYRWITHKMQIPFFESFSQVRAAIILIFFGVLYAPVVVGLFIHLFGYRNLRILIKYFEEFNLLGCFAEGQSSMVISDYLVILRIREAQYLRYFWLAFSYGMLVLTFCWFLLVKKVSSRQNLNRPNLPRN